MVMVPVRYNGREVLHDDAPIYRSKRSMLFSTWSHSCIRVRTNAPHGRSDESMERRDCVTSVYYLDIDARFQIPHSEEIANLLDLSETSDHIQCSS